jgi:hypothetical protein
MTGRAWELGRRGEWVVREFCRQQPGWFVIPTGVIGDKGGGPGAPMAEGAFEKIILPDLLVAMQGRCRWYDVKTKSWTPPNCNRGIAVTGCAYRNWRHYQRIQEETGIPGGLVFIQIDRSEIWMGLLDVIEIGSHTCMDLKRVEYGTIYFRSDQFDRYELDGRTMKPLLELALPAKHEQYAEEHQAIRDKVISEYKQRPLGFGAGERYQ